ncbi:MAG TPA: hypothetical protein VN181_10750, partial [Thermoanaerobaculia bacterium]|nr:hypothetical protein [Thermoanaerobaculia bacterium]
LRVKWGATTLPPAMRAGSSATVTVTFTNTGDKPWPDNIAGNPAQHDGANAVRLGYGWTSASNPDAVLERSPTRGDVPHSIQPGETLTLTIVIAAPATPGDYLLTFDLVQELLFWFSDRGADVLTVPVKVS